MIAVTGTETGAEADTADLCWHPVSNAPAVSRPAAPLHNPVDKYLPAARCTKSEIVIDPPARKKTSLDVRFDDSFLI
jgi:hypothetical protein